MCSKIIIKAEDLQTLKDLELFKDRPFEHRRWKCLLGIQDKEKFTKQSYWDTLFFIISILDIFLKDAQEKCPYVPHWRRMGERGMLPQDITAEQATVLWKNIALIESAYIKARVADVLWESSVLKECRRNMAEQAIESYFASASYILANYKLFKSPFLFAGQQIQRATTLMLSLKQEGLFQKLWDYFKDKDCLNIDEKNLYLLCISIFR